MTNLDSILKSRDISLPTKFHLVKDMVFLVVMYGCKSWTITKAEHQNIYAFELWCWIRLLRVPWTARRSNRSILKEISCEYSLVGLMLKLKLQYFGHLMRRTDSWEKTLMLGKIEGRRCIILHQNDRTFVLAPHSTLLMKNSKLLRPPSIKSKKELIQSNDRCMTTETGFFF